MTRDYDVLLDDGSAGRLHVALTDEGVIVDLYDPDGIELLASWGQTAQELTERLFVSVIGPRT